MMVGNLIAIVGELILAGAQPEGFCRADPENEVKERLNPSRGYNLFAAAGAQPEGFCRADPEKERQRKVENFPQTPPANNLNSGHPAHRAVEYQLGS